MPTSLSWLGGSVVIGDPFECVVPDDVMNAPALFEQAAVVPIIEQADIANENPAKTIAVTSALRYEVRRRLTVATSLAG